VKCLLIKQDGALPNASENLRIQSYLVTGKVLTKVSSSVYFHSYFITNMLNQGRYFTTRYPGMWHPSECWS